MPTPSTPIIALAGVGPKAAKDFAVLGIHTVGDLLLDIPTRYEDFRVSKPLALVRAGETVSVEGRLLSIATRRSPRKHMILTQAVIEDASGTLGVTWFRQPYLAKVLRPGSTLLLSGKVDDAFGLSLVNPQWEVKKEGSSAITVGKLAPIYRLSGVLTQKLRRSVVLTALSAAEDLLDVLPAVVRDRVSLPNMAEALRWAHTPETPEQAQAAVRRLAFEEVFIRQVALLQAKKARQGQPGWALPFDEVVMRSFVAGLPFALTTAQRKAAFAIVKDMEQGAPMHRLLEGDVGSGKTVVAALASFVAAQAGAQVAYAAPTEILATQQHAALCDMLGDHALTALLTAKKAILGREVVARTEVVSALKDGRAAVVVGTHALFSDAVSIPDLGLLIVDEQHRFGVEQRSTLLKPNHRGLVPHFLAMTATPIPRSLAMAMYGDMTMSILDELPPGRGKVETILLAPSQDEDAFSLMAARLAQGRQAYVVCPLIEDGEPTSSETSLGLSEAESVQSMCARLQKSPLARFGIAGLHGRMKTKEKDAVLAAFVAGEVGVLVSTTVVEVGVNVLNATVMFVEGAERFGLAQLHQLRGRVRRSLHDAVCFLHPSAPLSSVARERLQAMVESDDGFKLAEIDLQLRGSGDRFGVQQSGIAELKYASVAHPSWIGQASEAAAWYMAQDPELKEAEELKEKVEALGRARG